MTLSISAALLSMFSLGLTPSAHAQPEEIRDTLAALTREAVADSPAASISVAVYHHGKTLFEGAFGSANMELGTAASTTSVYRFASISKQFTAAAVLQLVERGRIALDDDVHRYVKLDVYPEPITIRQMLTHSSGMPSFTEFDTTCRSPFPNRCSREQILELLDGHPLLFKPGTSYSYSNTGYFVLALVVERVTGQSFGDYLTNEVLAKAGLKHTYYCDDQKLIPGRVAGYRRLFGKVFANVPPIDVVSLLGSGTLCGTPGDLITWTRALQEGRIVSKQLFNLMTTPGTSKSYGMALQLGTFQGHQKVYHGGDDRGFTGELTSYPDDDVIVAVVSNTADAAVSILEERIVRALFGLPDVPRAIDLVLSPAEAKRFTGAYAWPRRTLIFRYFDGHLVQSVRTSKDGEFSVLQNQGGGVFRFKNSNQYVKFKDGAMAMGDGSHWEAKPSERIGDN